VVDNFGAPDSTPMQPIEAEEAPRTKSGFLSTTLGKIVVGGAIFVVVLGALAAIAVIFIFGQSSDNLVKNPVIPAAETSGTASAEEASPTVRPEVPLEDTFAFRNIFQPTIKVTLSPVEGDGTSSDGSSVDVPADTLYLVSVTTVDGEPTAELIWNGQTYMLTEGESIEGTPWKVLSIDGDTVVMLYGDTRVTLTVGQGISK